MKHTWFRPAILFFSLLFLPILSSCTSLLPAASSPSAGVLHVVAGENFWGNIAQQLGGSHVQVTSILSNPNADPHEYQSSTVDARAIADADYVLLNGAGYDDWGQKLLSANPSSTRKVFTVASFLGKQNGNNPHFWYNPAYVEQVAQHITADYTALDTSHAAYYAAEHTSFEQALQPYKNEIAIIQTRYANTPVGATESIFVYMAQALRLNLISPPAFMQAISEGNDPSASDVITFQNQMTQHTIHVLVYNTQTSGTVTTNLQQLALQQHIPVVGISETMPSGVSFQQWQLTQLLALQTALSS